MSDAISRGGNSSFHEDAERTASESDTHTDENAEAAVPESESLATAAPRYQRGDFKDEAATLKSDPPISSLRDRIAAVQRKHRECQWDDDTCTCGHDGDHPGHVADAVIAELGLEREFSIGDDDGGRVLWLDGEEPVTPREGEVVQVRWITPWEERDEQA